MRPLSILLAAALSLGPLSARGQDIQKEGETPQRASEQGEKVQKTAEEAAKAQPAEGEEVSYEQVLADPDNVELNYRYAQGQIRRGDIKGAAATLERILMVKPDLARVRLLYALVLYRLDNLAEAERELKALQALEMPASLRAELDATLKLIEKRKRRTHLSGTLGFGTGWDSNRNASPSSGSRLFAGAPVTLTGTNLAQQDANVAFLAGLRMERDLGSQAGHSAFASLGYYRAEQMDVDTLDLQAYTMEFGATYKGVLGDLTPSAAFDHVRLSEETYLRTRGAKLRFSRRLSQALDFYLQAGHVFNDHIRTTDIPVATERTGNQTDVGFGAGLVLGPKTKLSLDYGHTQKDARKAYNAFDRDSIGLTHAWLLGKGRFLLSSVTLNLDRYRQPDAFVATKKRADDAYRLSWTFGQPLGVLGRPFKDLLATATYEHYHSFSNLTNFEYTNNKIGGMLVYQWSI